MVQGGASRVEWLWDLLGLQLAPLLSGGAGSRAKGFGRQEQAGWGRDLTALASLMVGAGSSCPVGCPCIVGLRAAPLTCSHQMPIAPP